MSPNRRAGRRRGLDEVIARVLDDATWNANLGPGGNLSDRNDLRSRVEFLEALLGVSTTSTLRLVPSQVADEQLGVDGSEPVLSAFRVAPPSASA